MVFKIKERTIEEQAIYNAKQERRNPVFIYHYCLNENLPKEHPDFCFNCWVDECTKTAMAQQNYKYCPECEARGFPKFTLKDRLKGEEIAIQMKKDLEKHKKENMSDADKAKGERLKAGRLAKKNKEVE